MIRYLVLTAAAALLLWGAYHTVRKLRRGGGCCGEHEAAESRVPVGDRHTAHYPYRAELEIGGMTCENCARRVENALNSLEGVWAKVDISTHTAKLRLKAPPDFRALTRRVAETGYAVLRCS